VKNIIDYFAYLIICVVLFIMRRIPRKLALRIAVAISDLAFLIDRRHRDIGMVNLAVAFPKLSESKRALILRGSYHNFARVVVESARLPLLKQSNLSTLAAYDPASGVENYLNARAQGKGVLFMTMHYGAWELLPYAHALYGHPLSFVIRKLDNRYLDRLVRDSRQASGNTVIDKKGAARRMMQELRHGRDVGILIDQSVAPEEGVFANFFGRPASSPAILAILALRNNAPVVCGTLRYSRRLDKHKIIFLPALEVIRTGNCERDILLNTEAYNKTLEHLIRQKPSQWQWMHRRWKGQPAGTANPVTYNRRAAAAIK
jgi:KDO2-lipid IV(A) lauroyltransferase